MVWYGLGWYGLVWVGMGGYEVGVGRQEDLPAQLYLGFCTEISLGERPPLMGEECAGPKGSGAGLFCQPGQLIVSASLQEREQSTECQKYLPLSAVFFEISKCPPRGKVVRVVLKDLDFHPFAI